jgi:hypothetical protein
MVINRRLAVVLTIFAVGCLVLAYRLGAMFGGGATGLASAPLATVKRAVVLAPVPEARAAKEVLSLIADDHSPDPQASDARCATIRRDVVAANAELLLATDRYPPYDSDGAEDSLWKKWEKKTFGGRSYLRKRVESLGTRPHTGDVYSECRYDALSSVDGFPLFQVGAPMHISYLYDDDSCMEAFRRVRPVVAASHWLKKRGIDLIFVVVPRMADVYIEHFVSACPPDGIIAPHARRAIHEPLSDDVEVVDGFSLFRPLRDPAPDYLYNAADTHWGPRAMRIMAKEVADRIHRYRFGKRARYGLPIVRTVIEPFRVGKAIGGIGDGLWLALTDEQAAIAEKAQPKVGSGVYLAENSSLEIDPPDDRNSPVLVIGHSFVRGFREQLIKETNLLVSTKTRDNQTTEVFGDLLREPELLDHTRVVVWIATTQDLTRFKPLPPVIQDAR